MKSQSQQIYKDHWQSYLNLGLIPYPASKTYKGPIVPWKDDLPAPCSDDYADWEEKYPDANVWVLLGEGFAVIDPDGPGAEDFVKALNLPEGPTSISGNKSIHRWFKVSSPIKPLKVLTGRDKTFLELRTGNLGMFAPPSIHPETKKSYRWLEGRSPWEIPFPELPKEAYEKIKALLPNQEPQTQPRMTPREDNGEGSLDLERYLKHYGIKFKVKPEADGTLYLLERCLFADQHTTKDIPGDSSIIQGSDGKLRYQCFHNHCAFKTWADARETISGEDSLAQFCEGYVAPSLKEQGRNLTEDVRAWLQNAFSKFNTEQIYKDLGISNSKDKARVRVELHRMVEKGLIERGSLNGTFIKLESQSQDLQIKDTVPTPLSLILPGNLHQRVAIYRKNLIVGAGSSNGGKTAYGLNCAWENRNKFDVYYFTTEMDSDELTLRIHNFGHHIVEWNKIKFKAWESYHSIKPDSFNILDYLEVREGEFWRIGDDLRKIFEKLQKGIALVFIQMDRGKQFGWGGQKTVDKARLYFTLDDNKLTIVKGKNWASSKDNPNGKVLSFKLHNGASFEWGHWS